MSRFSYFVNQSKRERERDCPLVWFLASDLPGMIEFAREIDLPAVILRSRYHGNTQPLVSLQGDSPQVEMGPHSS